MFAGFLGLLTAGPLAGVGAAFLWLLGLLVVVLTLFFGEKYVIDGGKDLGKTYDAYFASRVLQALGNGLSSLWSLLWVEHPIARLVVLSICGVGVALWLVSLFAKRT